MIRAQETRNAKNPSFNRAQRAGAEQVESARFAPQNKAGAVIGWAARTVQRWIIAREDPLRDGPGGPARSTAQRSIV